jgi:putative membrane protein
MLRIILAVLHLLALAIGLAAIWGRARALRLVSSRPEALGRVFETDTLWGLAGLLWVVTGLWRVMAGTEKISSYYWHNHVFLAKMGCLLVLILLEIYLMITLINWRRSGARAVEQSGALTVVAPRLARISEAQVMLVLAMLVAAVLMARGYGAGGS